MTRGSGSGSKKGGLFGWLFGRRGSAEAQPAATDPGLAVTEPPVTESPVERSDHGTGAAAEPKDAHAGGESEDDDELVLGPAFVAPAAEGGDEPREPGPSDAPGGQEREAEAQPDGSDEGQPEEEALLARLRAAGVEGAVGESALEREYRLPPEESLAAEPDAGQPENAPGESGEADLARLSEQAHTEQAHTEEAPIGEERTDGEGEPSASDPGPEGREPMEAPVTSRDDKADSGEAPAGPDTEHAAEAESLFLGAQASADADARKDPQAADERSAETSAETSDERPAETPAETTENAAEGAPADAAGDASHQTGALSREAGSEAESEPETEPETQPETEAAAETEPETDPETGPGSEFETRAAAESLAESLAATAGETPADPEPEPEQAAAAVPDAPAVSEETVRRLIREELEGEFGTRMSANIRRMIREEVSQALLRQR